MNDKNSATSIRHRLLLSLSDEIDLKTNNKYLTIPNLSIYYTKIINLKYQVQRGMKSLIYLMGHILCQLFEFILIILLKSIKHLLIIIQQKYM